MDKKRLYFLLKGELRLKLIDIRTYPLNTIASLFGILILIIPLALGLKNTGNIAQLMTLIFLPLLTSVAVNTSTKVKDCTDKGILEQCFNGLYSLLDIIIVNNVINIISNAFQTIIILIVILLNNPSLPITLIDFMFIFLIVLINGFSFGLLLCGFSLVYKKVGSLNNLISFLLLVELMLPIYLFPKSIKILFMVIAPAGGILSYAQSLVKPDGELGALLMIILVLVNSIIWLMLAIKTYNSYYNKARKGGTLAYY